MRPYVHFKTYRKFVSLLLVICFITIPLAFLTLPKKVEATCGPLVTMPFGGLSSVPVHSAPGSADATNLAQDSSSYFKECVMDGLAMVIAKTTIKALTKSIVNWINSGFKGNPSFVQNPGKFFTRIGDQVAGNIIEGIAPFLCDPFALNIQFSLALSMSTNMSDEIQCTLSDVIDNLEGFGKNSSVSADFSWDNWYNVTQNPQNNPYGAMMLANNQMIISMQSSQGKFQQQLDWGKGFLSFEDCSPDTNDYPVNGEPVYGVTPGNNNCVTKTPGAVIESQLENTIGSDLRGLEVAQSMDQILAALMGQLMNQVMGSAGGLIGATTGSDRGGNKINYNKYANDQQLPDMPISATCSPRSTYAFLGETMTWDIYITSNISNPIINWGGDNNLTGPGISKSIIYTTPGTKTAWVEVSTASQPTPVRIVCLYPIEVYSDRQTNEVGSCRPSSSTAEPNSPVTWSFYPSTPGSITSYNWGGTDRLVGSTEMTSIRYDTAGLKAAWVAVSTVNEPTPVRIDCSPNVTVGPTASTYPELSVSCAPNRASVRRGNSVTWTATATGGSRSYNYSWTGTDIPSPTIPSPNNTYTITYRSLVPSPKQASITVTDTVTNTSVQQYCNSTVTVNP